MISAELQGVAELQQQLLALGAIQARKTLARAVRKALKPVLDEMQRRAPVDTGLLRDSLKLTIKRPKSGAVLVAGIKVAVGKGGGVKDIAKAAGNMLLTAKGKKVARKKAWRNSAHWRWHFVEFGTKHKAARPFIRPTFDRNVPAMLQALKTDLAKEIAKTIKRNARKRKKTALHAEAMRVAKGG